MNFEELMKTRGFTFFTVGHKDLPPDNQAREQGW